MFQFPSNPTIGQLYNPVPGISYRWNGEAWYLVNTQFITLDQATALFVEEAEVGQPDGVASLDATGIVPDSQLPVPQTNLEAFPIGAIYLTANDNNPGGFLGGTWGRIGEGRVLLGVGTLGSDTYAEGDTGGEAAHALTADENGPHTHGASVGNGAGAFTGIISPASTGGANNALQGQFTMDLSGNGDAHENRQPYLAVYYWQRTA